MAFECAAKHGISDQIVQRARFVRQVASGGFDITPCLNAACSHHLASYEIGAITDSMTMTDRDRVELTEAESLARAFLKWNIVPSDGESLVHALERMLASAAETAATA